MTIENTSFKTRARTIDHLGREQIADCPTAISELWKNAYDAYAKSVELHIFDAPESGLPVAALVDDGHGMDKQEFMERWLVVGTESKATDSQTPIQDRGDIKDIRPRQGQKGIGRLSCAAMGRLLLLISKRKSKPFTAALIDWRLFENPFLVLDDIQLPVVEFERKEELSEYLPEMFESLMSNIWGSSDKSELARDARIISGWDEYEKLERDLKRPSTKNAIESTIIESSFGNRHFDSWSVWRDDSPQGTALFISDISDDLTAQLSQEAIFNEDEITRLTKRKLFETLSGFVDPYVKLEEKSAVSNFSASVIVWNGLLQRILIDRSKSFNIENLDQLEHYVEGDIDEKGIFNGSIRVSGEMFAGIKIKTLQSLASNESSFVGPFSLSFGTFEWEVGSTTHPPEQHTFFKEQADLYAGFRMYRDGFRIMPYGKEENDYFQIETRRSKNAGIYFWASRRMFGGIRITKKANPNLRDKAGREGLIDNHASKIFREIVQNLLIELGRKYFGTHSENRKELLPKIKDANKREKAEQNRNKLLAKQRKELRNKLSESVDRLNTLNSKIEIVVNDLIANKVTSKDQAIDLLKQLSYYSGEFKDLEISDLPASLGILEDEYRAYAKHERKAESLLAEARDSLTIILDNLTLDKTSAEDIILDEIQRKKRLLNNRIRKWSAEAKDELLQEIERLNELTENRLLAFHQVTSSLADDVENGRIELGRALSIVEDSYQDQSLENEDIFPPYISAIRNLRDQIDLSGIIAHALNESDELKAEISRLHALAQLGITVEIIGHEIEGLDITIERGLEAMPAEIKSTRAYQSVLTAHHSLSDKWRFLSPLKLSGEKIPREISGTDIHHYLINFFVGYFEKGDVELNVTAAFQDFRVKELPARIYPVFVNLINNARYWVRYSKEVNKIIKIDYVEDRVIIADNGPGVDEDDFSKLFSLFFTRKGSSGRGVGLYLCRANLGMGGHSIGYETDQNKKLLSGANFYIRFKK